MLGPAQQDESIKWSGAVAPDHSLSIRGVRKSFAGTEVLKGVDLELAPGEIVAVLGANGCGKSTLLRCAIRLLEPDAGEIRLCGRDLASLRGKELREARREAAVVFQQIALVRRRSALQNVCCGALGELPLRRSYASNAFPHEVRERAALALQRVGMLDKAWQPASTLSGGQAQRVAIARAYCQRASVILADEPVSALDPRAAEDVMELLADLAHRDRLGVLVVLHQPELALRYADRVVGMLLGEVVFDAKPPEVSPQRVAELYQHLHGA
ncbi:MAG: phosphonate ABC transporter ATP-binding protein [Solirubrobacterales bacterium]|nr:phosphonate ABC transporter ATP-binding protein [Solirubrobacterales bacterium]MBV9472242.1 phosphonate ABC transporter ATP-binding protein [Solirubrobacterales bacterium]MBV9839573.1 phosphonate ABC transporter ATP-binding protein [Solirubrobacterales bacterium]